MRREASDHIFIVGGTKIEVFKQKMGLFLYIYMINIVGLGP
jgi:hypothetical protein